MSSRRAVAPAAAGRWGWSALAAAGVWLGACGVMGPPRDTAYPAIEIPTRVPPAPPAKISAADAPRPPAAAPELRKAQPPAAPADGSARHGHLPDPPPLSERRQWQYRVDYDRGTLRVASPTLSCLAKARASPRRIGRYAFELWLGDELIERLRFDFPLLAAEEPAPNGPRKPLHEAPSFARGAQVSVTLDVPHSERANRARILDRATGNAVEVPWPPPPPADSGLALCTDPAASGGRTPGGDARR